MRPARYVVALAMLFAFAVQGFGQIPRVVAYQGVLSDTLGNPKSDGTYSLTFRLYQALTGGSALWTEQKTLVLKKGLFSTNLGDQVVFPASMKFDKPYYLSIQVASDPELSPRLMLSPGAFTLTADSARVAGTVPANSITGANIVDKSLTSVDILDGAGLNVQQYLIANTLYTLPVYPSYVYDSVIVAAPAAGYAIVFGSVTVVINHTNGSLDNVVVTLSRSPGGNTINYSEKVVRIPAEYPTNSSDGLWIPVEVFQVFNVSAGNNTFYFNVDQSFGTTNQIIHMTMSAIYVPLRYGSGSSFLKLGAESENGSSISQGIIPVAK